MKEEAKKLIAEFVKNEFPRIYDINKSRTIWKGQSEQFHRFWENRIMNDEGDLSENEMIPVIQILDVVGRRRNEQERKVEGVAFTGIRQNTWYEMFRGLKSNRKVKELVNGFLRSSSNAEQIELLNRISKDGTEITALAGENGTVLNAFLFAFNPEKNISVVALSDRYRIISFFEVGDVRAIQKLSWGDRIILARQMIMTLNEKLNLKTDGRGVCTFLYSDEMKRLWKQQVIGPIEAKKKRKTGVLKKLQRHDYRVGPNINFRDMDYGPTEENGVIFLFSKITNDLGIKMVSIQKHFPDAEAIKYGDDGRGYKVYIEFEYVSSDFLKHRHLEQMKKGKPCDLIVCWEHDSKDIPKEIEVLELREIIKSLPKETT
jgi:hypothetical protein